MVDETVFSTRIHPSLPLLVLALFAPACGGALAPSPDQQVDAGQPHTGESSDDAGIALPVPSREAGLGKPDSRVTTRPGPDASAEDAPSHPAPAPPAFPQVPTGGKTLSLPRLVTIVASNDVPSDGTDTVPMLQAFSDVLPTSQVWSSVASEYGLTPLSSVGHLTGPAIAGGVYSIEQVEAYVAGVIGAGTATGDAGVGGDAGAGRDAGLSPNGSTVYVVYLPSGATLEYGYCAYHAAYPFETSAGDEVAVIARCEPEPITENQLGELTRNATSSIIDAITDPLGEGYMLPDPPAQPWTGSAWLSSGDVFLGSMCAGTRIFETTDGGPAGGWELSRIWSNAAAAAGGDPCIPAHDDPYYTVSAPQGWYSAEPGETVTIPITGWSAGTTTSWLFSPAHVADTNDPTLLDGVADGGIASSSEAGAGTTGDCYVRGAMNDGTNGTVEVTMPLSAQSGDYLVVGIHSFREDPATCYPPATEDLFHVWPVGVYVP
jgi:hypothetical protein